MSSGNDLLPLKGIITPKSERPNLVENIESALSDPARTLRDYLFTPGIRGHFDRIFNDVREGRGGGYWVQAEYGGGKTHFLSTLLCLLGEFGDETEAEVWANVSDPQLREEWQHIIRPRRLCRAHISLMGTGSTLGAEQPRLVELIDEAVVRALESQGLEDPGIGAGDEVLQWYSELDPAIRSSVEGAFKDQTGMSVEAHRREYGSSVITANALLEAARSRGITPNISPKVREHFLRVLEQLQSLKFDGLLIVIDEYFSRQGVLKEAQALDDASVLETVGYTLGQQEHKPIYVTVATQGEIPAKLAERFRVMSLLRDEDKEYSQIVCKRVMDYKNTLEEQSILYHNHYSRNFQFLRRMSFDDTRQIFPFQTAVFRFMRDLVSSDRVGLPSTRFAIGVAYDAISNELALEGKRLVTRADLLVGNLERDLLKASELQESAAALREVRDFIENKEWSRAAFVPMAYRVVNHLFLDSIVDKTGQGQTLDQIVEGTLVEEEGGLVTPRQIAQTILRELKECAQIESKGESWKFAARVSEGEQFETVFQRTRRGISETDSRVQEKWRELLTANIAATGGFPSFLSPIVTPSSINVEHCGVQYPARAIYSSANLNAKLQPLERLTQAERVRVVVVPDPLASKPGIDDAAVAVVAPALLAKAIVDEIRGVIACQEIREDYRIRSEVGAERITSAAEQKERELIKGIVGRQRESYREGQIYTRDDLPLPPKQLFKDNLLAGLSGIASQLARHAYPKAQEVLSAALLRRGVMATVDAAKVFDGIFGGMTEAKTKGAGEAFGPLLGLTTAKDPLKLVPNAGPGPQAVAGAIEDFPNHGMAELYDQFCNEPYGLPKEIIDLWVLACVVLGKPYQLELRPPGGIRLQTREGRLLSGPIRANQLRQLAWPKGLSGFTIGRSKETTWNDFVSVAQAIDPQRFSMSTDQIEIDRQQAVLRERLTAMGEQIEAAKNTITALAQASGDDGTPTCLQALERLAGLAALGEDSSRDAALKYVDQAWPGGQPSEIKSDVQVLESLASLVGEAPRLSGRLSWFRTLSSAAPEVLQTEIEMTKPLVTLDQLTAGRGQLATSIASLEELWATFMARFRQEHAKYVAWVTEQREALLRAEKRLPTLVRLDQLTQLGPPELPSAAADVNRVKAALLVCEQADQPDVGNGTSCISCGFALGKPYEEQRAGEAAERMITEVIDHRARSLCQGLIGEAIAAAGDKDMLAILAAVQAGNIKKIVDDDLLTNELVKRLTSVLAKARQQTVATITVHEYLTTWRYVTRDSLDSWLQGLRQVLEASLTEAKKENPGKTITLLLREGDE